MEERKDIRGLKIQAFNYRMIAVACVLYLFILYATIGVATKYQDLLEASDEYALCQKNAARVESGSDFLTDQVRLYAVTMEQKYMENYFVEANVTKRRDRALEEFKDRYPDEEAYEELRLAVRSSNNLMEREIYSMKLISEANGYSEEKLPKEIQDTELKAADRELSAEEQIERARNLVFDTGYQDAKELIDSHLSYFIKDILKRTGDKQTESEEKLHSIIAQQRFFISVLFVMNVITFVIISLLIVRPLRLHIKYIRDEMKLQIVGSYEFKYLALTYNDIYDLNAANAAMLKHKIEHDPLTKVMNREGFNNLKTLLKSNHLPIALLLIDVDKFKNINDGWGHDMGDKILQKVGSLLLGQFRTADSPARIGGDEFAVIMMNIGPDQKEIISGKVSEINRALRNPQEEGVPGVSLSVGVAFSEGPYTDELFKKADQALYRVKENGRGGCEFY